MHWCCVLVLGLTLGPVTGKHEDHVKHIDKSHSAPEPCCVPKQWEGYIGGVASFKSHWYSGTEFMKDYVHFSYDAKHKRIAMNGTAVTKDGAKKFHVVELFEKKKMYLIDANGKCVSKDLKKPFHNMCVPDKAKHMGRYTMGLGNDSLVGDAWAMHVLGYEVYFSHTANYCVPVSEIAWGPGKDWHKIPGMLSMGYTDISPGIKSEDIFKPPMDCPTGDIAISETGPIMSYLHAKVTGQ